MRLSCFLLLPVISSVSCFEPISTSIVLGIGAIGGFKYFEDIKRNTYCKFKECCINEMVPFDILSLRDQMQSRLFGQHIVSEKVFQAVASHYKEIEKSQKPLVMSFHGTQGTGKNFVSNLIARAVFEKGTESQYYHVFHGSQYSNTDRVNEYRDQIKKEIFEAIESCAYSIFVFDEVDKMPPGIFDSITGMLDHHTLVKGKNFKRAIFIFLTNYGGKEITENLYQQTHTKGLYRHETKLHHFEDINKIGVFHHEGGLKNSKLIESAVIDFYIPFLPLEEKHIIQCIKAEYENFGHSHITKEMIDEILNYIGFNKITKYANTGCKTIHPKVRAESL
jgi:torsin-1